MLKASIVTVTYNVADTLQDTIDSVASQSFGSVEHLVIDGLSTDATLDVITRNEARLAGVVVEKDNGLYHAMNKGIELATGDVVGFLNGDDYYADPDVLSVVMDAFENPQIDAVYGDLIYISKNDKKKVVRYWTSQSYKAGLFDRGWIPAHPTFFVRRRIYEQYGGFDLQYKIQSDFEICMRLLAIKKIRSTYIPRILVHMRTGGVTNNSVRTVLKGNLESYRACKQHGLAVTPWFFVTKWAQRVPQFFAKPPQNYTDQQSVSP